MQAYTLVILSSFLALALGGTINIDDEDDSAMNRLLRSKRYIIFDKDKPNKGYQTCMAARNQPGHCKHIAYCKVPGRDMREILEKLCIINQEYVGVCCPDDMGAFDSHGSNIVYNLPSTGDADVPAVHDQNAIIFKTPTNRGCGMPTNTDTNAEKPDWPWMAALMVKGEEHSFCGAVVITENHVITAAHCLKGYFEAKDIEVRLGEYDYTSPTETRYRQFPVKSITVHPDFDKATYDNDIAVVELDRPTNFNTYIWPICLPPADIDVEGKDAYIVGWGTTEFSGPTADILQEIKVPIWSEDECRSAFVQPISARQFCAAGRNGGLDSCQGDSGGPLMFQLPNGRWVNLGVVSWGVRCGERGRAGIYTKVNEYLEWIAQHTRVDE